MALRKIKLGKLIEQSEETNSNLEYTLDDVKGMSIKKVFIETKADMEGVSLKPYLLVKAGDKMKAPKIKCIYLGNNISDTDRKAIIDFATKHNIKIL